MPTNPTLEGPLTGILDLRSNPDQLSAGTVRMRQNLQCTGQGKLRRGTGFEKFLNVGDYNNEDFHDQLLIFTAAARSPVTMLFEAESTRRVRSLVVGNQTTLAQLNQYSGNYRILGSGFGGTASTSANAPRFKAARLGDYVVFTNNFDFPQYMVLEQPPDVSGNYLATIPELETIGLTKAYVIWEWRSVLFMANVVMDNDRISYRILWSDFDDPLGWDPATQGTISGFKDLYTHEEILAAAPAGNSFLIYTTHGIWEMIAVGGDQSFDFRRVYNGETKEGSDTVKAVLAYPNTLTNIHDAHCYLGHDGIYLFNQYYSKPERPEWLHKASADLFANLDTSVCEPHVACPFGDEILFSVARVGAVNQCPDYTLRANKTYEMCDVVDHGFLSFCQYDPQSQPTVRDFILQNEICTLSGLAAAGYPFGNEGLPLFPYPGTPPPAFTPDSIYSTTRLAVAVTLSDGTVDTVYVEDYTQPSSAPTSLCALVGNMKLAELCAECKATPLFVAASSHDWCLKQLGRVFYREICQNPTAVGTSDANGYASAVGSYALDGITSLLTFSPARGNNRLVQCNGLQLDFVPVAQTPPSNISLRIGISAQAADPNDPNAPIVWFQRSSQALAYSTVKTSAQHLAAKTIPDLTLDWNFFHEGRIVYIELTIPGVGGDSTFSRVAANLQLGAEIRY